MLVGQKDLFLMDRSYRNAMRRPPPVTVRVFGPPHDQLTVGAAGEAATVVKVSWLARGYGNLRWRVPRQRNPLVGHVRHALGQLYRPSAPLHSDWRCAYPWRGFLRWLARRPGLRFANRITLTRRVSSR